jgi:DNA-binding LacI/PurR family transcriptional regulator
MPIAEMTAAAARLAMDEAEDRQDGGGNFVVTPQLVVRKSTGQAPGR